MTKLLLFGATGHLGKAIAGEAARQGYNLTVVVRNAAKAAMLSDITNQHIIADVTNPQSLSGICTGFDIVISALGKSVSPNDNSKPSFHDIDYMANSHILEEALRSGVKKMVYISAFGAGQYPHLTYFKVHHDFSQKLVQSGIDYSIIKPPALFSAFLDMIPMARKGQLVNIGRGDKKTNPIFEGDLAKVIIQSIHQPNTVIEAGGKEILTRRQLNEIIQRKVAPNKKLRTIPLRLVTSALPLLKVFNRNLYDKMAFFTEVMQHDTVAPQVGETRLEEYIREKAEDKRLKAKVE